MGNQPAVLIIARHGARLDQADRDWHSTAREPWDSPLSYGGWIQCQTLGARIASELSNIDAPFNNEGLNARDGTPANPQPRKRRKITIHTSPYLRCLQTSIAIAAGLRQSQDVPRIRPVPTPFQRSSLSKPPMLIDEATPQPTGNGLPTSTRPTKGPDTGLTDLKIDAWLGEWLSSGYFEKSKPPPPSAELVSKAKTMLKKAPEEIRGADLSNSSVQEFDEVDWPDKAKEKEIKDLKSLPTHEKTGLRAMAAKGHSMPRRTRTISLTTNRDTNGGPSISEPVGRRPRSTTYSPPVPNYSIASRETIPQGYVAHARDACIDTDFEWDSQQPPLAWGDGGTYEEEWSTMHHRFRNGLQGLLTYYESDLAVDLETEEESEEDQVVILVTHQAGCNALIRLVTGAPALHDVGTASLTLATRKQGLTRQVSAGSSPSPTRRRGSLDLGLKNDYDMKIIASTEHLRAGSNPLGLNSPRLAMSPASSGRRMVGADSLEGFSLGDPLTWRSASQSAAGRSGNIRGHPSSGSISNESLAGAGLWSTREGRSSSISSDASIDPRSPPGPTPKSSGTNISSSIILEDEAIEDWAKHNHKTSPSYVVASPISIEDQTIWQPLDPKPVRRGSTMLSGNAMAGTGLWGSPVANPGGVKEGTPHSRSSFGTSDANAPTWGPRSSTQRNSWQSSKTSFTATEEETEAHS